MSSLSLRFGELCSLARSLHGQARWRAMIKLLEAWPQGHLEQVVLPYLHDILRADHTPRYPPAHWYGFAEGSIDFVHPAWPLCSALDLYNTEPGDEGAQNLASSAHLEHISYLNLWNTSILAQGVQAIVQSPHLARCRVLNLGGNMFGDVSVKALARSLSLPALSALSLAWNLISMDGAIALAECPQLAQLSFLNLETNNLGAGAEALRRSPYLSPGAVLKL